MRKPYHPDDSGMTWQDERGNRKGGGNGGGGGYKAPAFVGPAETKALAQDMSDEFGGSVRSWRRDLNWQPKLFNFGGGHGNGGGNNQGGTPTGGGDHSGGGFDPSNPRNHMMPMQPGPGLLAYPRDRGLLGVPATQIPPQQQQQQAQPNMGLLGNIPPEVLAFIRSNRGM